MPRKFTVRGVITALVTPFKRDGELYEESLREVVQFQIKSGVNGLFPLGTTGMGPAIGVDQRKRAAEVIVDEVNGQIPVIVQIGASDPTTSIDLARHAEKIGADAVAALTPFYYHPGEDATIDHFTKLAQATELPLFIYNIPSNTGNNINPNLLLRLSKIPKIVGIKDSSRDFSQLLDYLSIVPSDFNVINGMDSYQFSAFCAGLHAGVSATANAFPELFVAMYQAYLDGDLEEGRLLQLKIHSLRKALVEPSIAAILETLKMRGLKGGFVKPPLRSLQPDEVEALHASIGRVMPEMKLSV